LEPAVTLTTSKNRVIRAIYLAAKLDFDLDPAIIAYVRQNPESVKVSTNNVMTEKMNEAFKRDADKASHLIAQMGLWNHLPISDAIYPYYEKYLKGNIVSKAYFQGGGGVNEPTPGKPKYKAQPAITVQPRFVEPFYRNYDLYNTEGVDGHAKHGPGAGWHHMNEYKSIKEYLEHQRQRLKGKYVAEDTYITEENHKEREKKMKLRATLLNKIIKESQRNYDFGKGLYENMDKYKSVEDFRDHADVSLLDFPIDDQVTPILGDSESFESPIKLGPATDGQSHDGISPGSVGLGDTESYPASAQIGGYLDKYLPTNDFENKTPDELDFGRDYTDESDYLGGRPYEVDRGEPEEKSDKLDELEKKYNPAPTSGLYGLPDGVDLPDEDLGDPTTIQPDYGTPGPESLMYEDKWNI
jgi:hypothetical protein